MRFPRNAKIFKGQLDAAPFAGVFFLLVIFLLLAALIYTPGVRVQLPEAVSLPGTDHPTLAVALDASGQLFFDNQIIQPAELKARLRDTVKESSEPITLVVRADKSVRYETLIRLTLLAREAGVKEALLATLPRPFEPPAASPPKP
jgi:biopolymer transport protein ExbD